MTLALTPTATLTLALTLTLTGWAVGGSTCHHSPSAPEPDTNPHPDPHTCPRPHPNRLGSGRFHGMNLTCELFLNLSHNFFEALDFVHVRRNAFAIHDDLSRNGHFFWTGATNHYILCYSHLKIIITVINNKYYMLSKHIQNIVKECTKYACIIQIP